MHGSPLLTVCPDPADDPILRRAAAQWAQRLSLPEGTPETTSTDVPVLCLLVTRDGLALHALHGPANLTRGRPVRIDLQHLDTTTGPGRSLRQPLMRAVGLRKGDPRRPSVLDATAGFGEDAWLLASRGCPVLAVERDAVVAAMLEEAIDRAAATAGDTAALIRVLIADSRALLEHLAAGQPLASFSATSPTDADATPAWRDAREETDRPEVVYIDPMFPPGRKTAERKAMAMLRTLVGEDVDADALLAPARRAARRRVVVKRGPRSEPLAGIAPAASHRGRGVRYDVYPAIAN